MGKLFATANFALGYVVTAELYPTPVRNSALGLCSLAARVGGIVAPQIVLYFPTFLPPYSALLLLGLCSILAAPLPLLLQETAGRKLPETWEEVRGLGEDG